MSASSVSPPRSYWVISGLALLWNLVGLAAYINQVTMSPEGLAELPEAQRTVLENTPAWATSAFAIATTTGVLDFSTSVSKLASVTAMVVISIPSL